ncbi:MAG: rRNA pseudouridine synthase [Firmicutes bacterium]|uniref:Pseudouridine synthase n=1 Tax=Candidatus Stercoripulliclostridium pullicola TaxID=2840953 RepID=A0A940DF49_9FIRM|nr:rRNA pseudouridine synthase [Candidatus Stercoripulliclostridium pullicola]
MRLNKYIAECGAASRRGADKLISDGLVKVNNKVVTELGTIVNEDNDTVTVNGKKLVLRNRDVYIILNKPKGCITAVKDDKGRKTVMDYVESKDKRLFPVGRLDYDSEGLVLLTNDGDTAYKLTHPSSEIPKTYIAKVEGEIPEKELDKLRDGIPLDGAITHRAKIKVLGVEDLISRIEITIFEGKNRQIRRMFEYIGYNVIFLKRTAIGEIRLGGLGRGLTRYLTPKEIQFLKKL